MKILPMAPACWATKEIAEKKIWLYLTSCRKFGIEPKLYGTGMDRYEGSGWIRMDAMLAAVKEVDRSEFTHVLYTDAWDLLFTVGLDEITMKYERFGCPPMLMAAGVGTNVNDLDAYLDVELDDTKFYRYPAQAAYIAEIGYLVDAFERMDKSRKHDETYAYMKAWKEEWFRPVLDHQCEIFQDHPDHCRVVNGWDKGQRRLYNEQTDTYPCTLHFGGGFTDQETGKDERIIPWAKELVII